MIELERRLLKLKKLKFSCQSFNFRIYDQTKTETSQNYISKQSLDIYVVINDKMRI